MLDLIDQIDRFNTFKIFLRLIKSDHFLISLDTENKLVIIKYILKNFSLFYK